MITFRDVLSNVLGDLNLQYENRINNTNKYFKPILKIYLLVTRLVAFQGFRAVTIYRCKNYAFLTKNSLLLRVALLIDSIASTIDISPAAEIGRNLSIPHARCIVIGEAIIGHNVKIYQGVTLGATWDKEKDGRRYPVVGDNVKIGAGAKIIGPVSIGENSVIGANAVVISDIPANCIAAGNPATVIKRTI